MAQGAFGLLVGQRQPGVVVGGCQEPRKNRQQGRERSAAGWGDGHLGLVRDGSDKDGVVRVEQVELGRVGRLRNN
jgi:hypothetical protein